jgi:hypothetical protein
MDQRQETSVPSLSCQTRANQPNSEPLTARVTWSQRRNEFKKRG